MTTTTTTEDGTIPSDDTSATTSAIGTASNCHPAPPPQPPSESLLQHYRRFYNTIPYTTTTSAAAIPQQEQQQLQQNENRTVANHSRGDTVRDGDYILLHFVDGRQMFAYCCYNHHINNNTINTKNHTINSSQQQLQRHNKKSLVRINKRSYSTQHLIGLPYGTILEQEPNQLLPIRDHSAKLIPELHLSTTTIATAAAISPTPMDADDNVTPPMSAITTLDGSASMTDHAAAAAAAATTTNTATTVANVVTTTTTPPNKDTTKDNRTLVDTNTAQLINYPTLLRMRQEGQTGASIVASMVEHSTTYSQKTMYAQNKYIVRKQMKHQPRCRIVPCHGVTITEAMYKKDPKRIMNVREDTLGQILSYANLSAGCQTLVMESCGGIVTGAMAERMGGYGKILSIYDGQQPAYLDMLSKFNLSFAEWNSIQWVHAGDVFHEEEEEDDTTTTTHHHHTKTSDAALGQETTNMIPTNTNDTGHVPNHDPDPERVDVEQLERDALLWPCVLQAHTRQYLERLQPEPPPLPLHPTDSSHCNHNNSIQNSISSSKSSTTSTTNLITSFLLKRAARFARKLCRHTSMEAQQWLQQEERPCDSIVLVTRYDPTATLLQLFPYLIPSGPFVIYCEFMEPLTHCFRAIQQNPKLLSINLRLSDTWMREYQVLEGRTHPNMSMSQSGGFILTGIKLDPRTGQNELDETLLKEIREERGGRRGRKKKKGVDDPSTTTTTQIRKKRQRMSTKEETK
jgi:tRNA (adenine58-N1)-methyltransferase non-catalytic subunit